MHGVSTPGTQKRASHLFTGVELFSSPLKSLIFSLRLSGAFSLSLLILLSFLRRVAERESLRSRDLGFSLVFLNQAETQRLRWHLFEFLLAYWPSLLSSSALLCLPFRLIWLLLLPPPATGHQ